MASVFTKIINREIPGYFVWEDELCVAIMTIQPVRDGHVLVIPKQEIDHWDNLPDELHAHLMIVCKKIAKALKATFPSRRIGLLVAGFEVPHAHIHLMPIDTMHDFDLSKSGFAESETLKSNAGKIRKAL